MQRQKLPQELFSEKILVLLPNAKFSIRKFDGDEGVVSKPIIRGEFLIDWYSDDIQCPSLEDINNVRNNQVDEKLESDRKRKRNERYSRDLAIKAIYLLEKKDDPTLLFDDYLDRIETTVVN